MAVFESALAGVEISSSSILRKTRPTCSAFLVGLRQNRGRQFLRLFGVSVAGQYTCGLDFHLDPGLFFTIALRQCRSCQAFSHLRRTTALQRFRRQATNSRGRLLCVLGHCCFFHIRIWRLAETAPPYCLGPVGHQPVFAVFLVAQNPRYWFCLGSSLQAVQQELRRRMQPVRCVSG